MDVGEGVVKGDFIPGSQPDCAGKTEAVLIHRFQFGRRTVGHHSDHEVRAFIKACQSAIRQRGSRLDIQQHRRLVGLCDLERRQLDGFHTAAMGRNHQPHQPIGQFNHRFRLAGGRCGLAEFRHLGFRRNSNNR